MKTAAAERSGKESKSTQSACNAKREVILPPENLNQSVGNKYEDDPSVVMEILIEELEMLVTGAEVIVDRIGNKNASGCISTL